MSNEFLLKEYELCFEQLRFYDTRHEELTKYLFTLTSAVVVAEFALLEYLKAATPSFFIGLGMLSFLVFVATVLLYTCMLQNRMYFVFVARQINAIRGHLMVTDAPGFTDNQMYTRFDFPAFRFRSLHTVYLFGASLISSVFGGSTAYGFASYLKMPHPAILTAIVACVVGILELVLGLLYLQTAGKKDADDFLTAKKGKPEQAPERDA